MRSGDLVVTDQFAHASIVDGIILSKAQVRYFRHNNAADLERKLKDFPGRKLVIVEGVYSMDGDLANLPEIVEVAKSLHHDRRPTGSVRPQRRGVAEHFGGRRDTHPLRYLLEGGQGGYVVGSRKLIRYLKGFARSPYFSAVPRRGRRTDQGLPDRARRAQAAPVDQHRLPAGTPARARCRHQRRNRK
jgi:7-keto-8-aminopelargonate synthetase-like enzyme